MATDITLSKANSLRWAHVDGNLPSFDNTLVADEDFSGISTKVFCQRYVNGGTLFIQIKAETAATVVLTKYLGSGASSAITADDTTAYATAGFTIYDYTITLATDDDFHLQATSETSTWTSEPVLVEASLDGYLKLEWFNNDPTNSSNNFEFDYSTTTAIANVNKLYVKANLFKYSPAGESEIFDNQNEKVKLKSNLYRKLAFETEQLPRCIAEQIQIAMDHDYFVVNDVAYIVEDASEPDPFGKTNMTTVTADLTTVNSLGLNTHDIGYDCATNSDTMIENKVIEPATSSGTFSISDGYGVTQIIARESGTENDGDVTLKVGTTITGQEIMYSTGVPIYSAAPLIDNNRFTPDTSGAWTLYYTLSGASPSIDLFIQTIKFAQ